MTKNKSEAQMLLSPDDMARAFSSLWNTHELVLAINNRFVADMQTSTTLGPEDEARLQLWSKAVARAQSNFRETLEALNIRPAGTAEH